MEVSVYILKEERHDNPPCLDTLPNLPFLFHSKFISLPMTFIFNLDICFLVWGWVEEGVKDVVSIFLDVSKWSFPPSPALKKEAAKTV